MTDLFVSECPLSALSLCHWRSDPVGTEDAAREALRAHTSGHPHGELVDFAAAHMTPITRYVPVVEAT